MNTDTLVLLLLVDKECEFSDIKSSASECYLAFA